MDNQCELTLRLHEYRSVTWAGKSINTTSFNITIWILTVERHKNVSGRRRTREERRMSIPVKVPSYLYPTSLRYPGPLIACTPPVVQLHNARGSSAAHPRRIQIPMENGALCPKPTRTGSLPTGSAHVGAASQYTIPSDRLMGARVTNATWSQGTIGWYFGEEEVGSRVCAELVWTLPDWL